MLFFFFFSEPARKLQHLYFFPFLVFPFLKLKTSVNVSTTCSPLFVFVSRHKRVFDIKWLYAELYQLTWWSNLLLFRRIPNWSKGPNRLCSWVVHSPFHIDVTQGSDGRVAERLGPRAWNSVILGSSPIELFSSLAAVRQLFTSLARHASGQLVDFTLVGSPVSFLLNKSCQSNCFVKFEGGFIYFSNWRTIYRFNVTTALRPHCSRTILACIRLIETYCCFNFVCRSQLFHAVIRSK